MSLEVTSKVTHDTATGYDQITGETSVTTPNLTKTSYNRQEGRSERNLVSESTADGAKKNESKQKSNSERKVNSKTKTSRASVEKANIAFTLAFSIPLTGIIPTGSKSNC